MTSVLGVSETDSLPPTKTSRPPGRGKALFMDDLVAFLTGKEYLVFQVDDRISKLMDYGEFPANLSSFATSVFGPSILAMSRWAKTNNYAYLLVVSPSKRMRHPYNAVQSISGFWKKSEALGFLHYAALKAGMKGVLYADSDVVPEYQPKSLTVLRQWEFLRNKTANTSGNQPEASTPKTVSRPSPIGPYSKDLAEDDNGDGESDTDEDDYESAFAPNAATAKETLSVPFPDPNLTMHDACQQISFRKNVRLANLEQFIALAGLVTESLCCDIILPPGHKSSSEWLYKGRSYPSNVESVNAGVVFTRTTQVAQRQIRAWYPESLRGHIPLEARDGRFDIVHPSSSVRQKVAANIDTWMRQTFPSDGDLLKESLCTPSIQVRSSKNLSITHGRFRCRGANMTMMEDLWQNTLCNRDRAAKLFEELRKKDRNATTPHIKCRHAAIKYRSHYYRGWPGDQSRLQWLVFLDHIRNTNLFSIPKNPVISSDETEYKQQRLLYHAGTARAKLLMGLDYTKLMMQDDLKPNSLGLCDPQWRLNWFQNAWKEISLLPGVQFRPSKEYSGSFDDFEEEIRLNRRPVTMFNVLPRNNATSVID